MIVLDAQLLGRNLNKQIAQWYRGSVRFITELRPFRVIKDDAIGSLLQRENQPTFLTINERDFWQKISPNKRYCVVCFALSDARAFQINPMLRTLLKSEQFSTKANRMGYIIRVTSNELSYYSSKQPTVKTAAFSFQ